MKLVNVSRNIVLADDIALLRGIFEKAEGLSGAAAPHAIFFRTEWGTCPVPKSEHTKIRGRLYHIFRNCIHYFVDFPLFWCGVHTLRMHFPIDVVIMDDAYIVREIRQNLQPNRFFFWNPKYRNVAELPSGTALPNVIMTGDTLALTEEK